MSDKQQTQFEETLAVITIPALLLGAGAYVGTNAVGSLTTEPFSTTVTNLVFAL